MKSATIRHFVCFLFFALLVVNHRAAASPRYPELSGERIKQIAEMLPQAPAGFGVPCVDRNAWNPLASYYQGDVRQAESFLSKPLPAWNDDAYLQYSRDGERKEGEMMLQRHTGQLRSLVVAECSEWQGRFLPRIREQLLAIAKDRAWTLPAHDPKLENFYGRRYYVDLGAAILSHNVAEALYLLGDKVPPSVRRQVMESMELHIFMPMRGAFAGKPEDATYISWLTAEHNWNAVCLDGVVDAALTILPDRQDRALFAAAAEHWSGNYLDSFTNSGYDTEGIGYWAYGFSHYDELREQLWLSTGGRVDLFNNPKARRAALFGFQFAMLPGVYADFADAHFMMRPDPWLLAEVDRTFRLGMYTDDVAIMRGAASNSLSMAVLAAFPPESERRDVGENSAALIGIRTWYPEPGILVDRPNPDGKLAVTIKAGGNGNHSHNDVGSYSIGVGSTQIVGDPGGPAYYDAAIFGPNRYKSRLMNSYGHPVPVVDGTLQKEATTVHPTVVSTTFAPDEDSVSMDITSAYDQPKLHRLIRTLHYYRKQQIVQIVDNFEVTEPTDIVESFPTHGECRQLDSRTLQFDFEGNSVELTIDAPSPLAITRDDINDYANRFTRVGAHLRLRTSSSIVMTFKLAPPIAR